MQFLYAKWFPTVAWTLNKCNQEPLNCEKLKCKLCYLKFCKLVLSFNLYVNFLNNLTSNVYFMTISTESMLCSKGIYTAHCNRVYHGCDLEGHPFLQIFLGKYHFEIHVATAHCVAQKTWLVNVSCVAFKTCLWL